MDPHVIRHDAFWALRRLVDQLPEQTPGQDQATLDLISETALTYKDQIHKASEQDRLERDVQEVFGEP